MRKRKLRPATVRTMGYHRGLSIYKAKRGGWYIVLGGRVGQLSPILYATHDWSKVEAFIKRYPILIKRSEV